MSRSTRIPVMYALALFLVGLTATVAVAEKDYIKGGWFKAGSDANGYSIGTEKSGEGSVAYIKSDKPAKGMFGTLMQSFAPGEYKGDRIRLSARIRTNSVKKWAGMWMRVDADGKAVSFDNMMDRPLKGTTDWTNYSIVLDVPHEADQMSIGLLLNGAGEAYWDDLKIETVGLDVPVTGSMSPSKSGPSNLDFEE